eukprot:8410489-Lingulodinium_polyedra.AAC.1
MAVPGHAEHRARPRPGNMNTTPGNAIYNTYCERASVRRYAKTIGNLAADGDAGHGAGAAGAGAGA